MLVCVYQGFAVIRTPFDEKYDLIQKFRGMENDSIRYNKPIDFMEAGLMQKDKWDYWHIDVPFALNTDEAVPAFVNDCFIGANHGHHGAVAVRAPKHGKTVKDVGSFWVDESGVKFTLLRVENEDWLLFISENERTTTDYKFNVKINGTLTYLENGENTENIISSTYHAEDLRRAIRHKKKQAVAFKDGEEYIIRGETNCDYVELQEEYDIINPATVAEALRSKRPKGGYERQPDLADFGEPMLACKLVYRIVEDGTVLILFDYERLMDVHFQRYMGLMYQEKIDVYQGGIYRYLPKTLPFETQEGRFDFSDRVPLVGKPYPKSFPITKEYWSDEKYPCERAVDYFCDVNGTDKLAYASGFLPVYDGVPSVRRENLTNVVSLKFTRKHYPTFMNGDLSKVKGVGYKKYFIPQKDKASVYSVEFDGKTYLYADFFKQEVLELPINGKISLIEKGEGIAYEIQNDVLKINGEKGGIAFVIE